MNATLVYLHGFRSSPASVKAQALQRAVDALPTAMRPQLHIPLLAFAPTAAMAAVDAWLRQREDDGPLTFVGSSLGGFYAIWLAERHAARAVLINPALRPFDDLLPYGGEQTNLYTGESFSVMPSHFDELRGMAVTRPSRPERILLLVESGDELLDYRQAVAYCAGAFQLVRGGGDHSFTDFSAQIPVLLRFAGVTTGGPG